MEVKPTVFTVVGFFVPGAVLLMAAALLVASAHYGSPTAMLDAVPKRVYRAGVLPTTMIVGAILVVAAVAGSVLSDSFILVARQLVGRPIWRPQLRKSVKRLRAHRTLEALVSADLDARESLVYLRTSGLDLEWYAGRVRMMGASGMGLLLVSVPGLAGFGSCGIALAFAGFGIWAIGVALYRSKRFDEYIAAASFVLLRQQHDASDVGAKVI
jgi:hypothetical protein